jgi:hypothetical protein
VREHAPAGLVALCLPEPAGIEASPHGRGVPGDLSGPRSGPCPGIAATRREQAAGQAVTIAPAAASVEAPAPGELAELAELGIGAGWRTGPGRLERPPELSKNRERRAGGKGRLTGWAARLAAPKNRWGGQRPVAQREAALPGNASSRALRPGRAALKLSASTSDT